MRIALVVLLYLGAAAYVLATDRFEPPRTALSARLERKLAAETAPAPADPDEPAAEPDLGVDPPPLADPAPAATLRTETMPTEAPATPLAVRRVVRAPSWIVYHAPRSDAPPRLHPLVGQSALVISPDAIHFAGRLTPHDGVLWIVELATPVAKLEAKAGDAALPLLAAGPDALSCRVLVTAAAREQARDFACAVFLADASARAILVNGVAVAERTPAPVPATAGEVGALDLPRRPVTLETAGARFTSARLPTDAPDRVPALLAGPVQQTLATIEVEGTPVPLLIAIDGRRQVAGTIVLETTAAVLLEEATFQPLAQPGALPALGSADLAHSVPGVQR